MSSPSRRFRPVVLFALTTLLFSAVVSPVTAAKPSKVSPVGSADKTVLFASDGMRPDLVQKFASRLAELVRNTSYSEAIEAARKGKK